MSARPAKPASEVLRRGRRLVRRLTWPARPLPDVAVIGAMKAGSTSAHALMCDHPLVRGPARKEVHFLDRYFERGEGWYRSQFPVAPPGRNWLAVESTPFYLSYPLAPSRLRDVAPDVILVALLRDPVDRAVSQWKQRTREGREGRPLADVLAGEREIGAEEATELASGDLERYRRLILTHGHYAHQLRRWFATFGRERVLIVDSQQLFDEPQLAMDAIFDFVGLETCRVRDRPAENPGDDRRVEESVLSELGHYYRPFNDDLFELLDTRFEWR